DREAEWRLVVHVVIGVQLRSVVIDSIAAAQAGAAVAECVIGEPEARSKMIKLTRRGAGWDRRSGRSFVSGVEQSGRRVHEDLRHSACLVGLRLELNDAIIKVCDREVRYLAQPEAQRHTRCRAQRVAPVEA